MKKIFFIFSLLLTVNTVFCLDLKTFRQKLSDERISIEKIVSFEFINDTVLSKAVIKTIILVKDQNNMIYREEVNLTQNELNPEFDNMKNIIYDHFKVDSTDIEFFQYQNCEFSMDGTERFLLKTLDTMYPTPIVNCRTQLPYDFWTPAELYAIAALTVKIKQVLTE